MATIPTKMNIIKQVLTGRKNGKSIRKLADMYGISWKNRSRLGQCAGESWDTFDVDIICRSGGGWP